MSNTHAIAAIIAANSKPPFDIVKYPACGACHSTAHRITQCPQIARFDMETYLRVQNLYLYDAIGSALALVRQDSYGAAEVVLRRALKGTRMAPDPPPPPEENPDKDTTPQTEGPSQL